MKSLKSYIITIAAFATIMLASSCSTSNSALQDLRAINYRIQTEGSTYGVKEWKNTAEDYYAVDKKIAKYAADGKYNSAEMQEIGSLQSQCIKGFKQGVKENIAGKIGDAFQFIKGVIDGWNQ